MNHYDPRVTIIIPCYRQGHFLANAVDSALNQTYQNVEVVVINDGSDDNTDQVAKDYGNKIRYHSKPNGGLSAARNSGIELATGDYVVFLDADDELAKNTVEESLKQLDGQSNAATVAGFKSFNEDNNDRTWLHSVEICDEHVQLTSFIHHNAGPCHSFMVPLEAVRKVGSFETSLDSCEDWDLWNRLLVFGISFVAVEGKFAYYRDTPDSMSKNKTRMLRTRARVLSRLHDLLLENLENLNTYGEELIKAEVRVLRRCLAQNVRGDHVRELRLAIADLRKSGIPIPHSRRNDFLWNAFGSHSEDLTVWYYRFFEQELFNYYLNDYK